MKTKTWLWMGAGAGLLYLLSKRQGGALVGLDDLSDLGKRPPKPPKRTAKSRGADAPLSPIAAHDKSGRASTATVEAVLRQQVFDCGQVLVNLDKELSAKGRTLENLTAEWAAEMNLTDAATASAGFALQQAVLTVRGVAHSVLADILSLLTTGPGVLRSGLESAWAKAGWQPSDVLQYSAGANPPFARVAKLIDAAQWEFKGKFQAAQRASKKAWPSLALLYETILSSIPVGSLMVLQAHGPPSKGLTDPCIAGTAAQVSAKRAKACKKSGCFGCGGNDDLEAAVRLIYCALGSLPGANCPIQPLRSVPMGGGGMPPPVTATGGAVTSGAPAGVPQPWWPSGAVNCVSKQLTSAGSLVHCYDAIANADADPEKNYPTHIDKLALDVNGNVIWERPGLNFGKTTTPRSARRK
jgi:hypothetical protein